MRFSRERWRNPRELCRTTLPGQFGEGGKFGVGAVTVAQFRPKVAISRSSVAGEFQISNATCTNLRRDTFTR